MANEKAPALVEERLSGGSALKIVTASGVLKKPAREIRPANTNTDGMFEERNGRRGRLLLHGAAFTSGVRLWLRDRLSQNGYGIICCCRWRCVYYV